MSGITIKNIPSLLSLPAQAVLKDEVIKRLTAPGENYGSLMLSLDLVVQMPEGEQEINTVVKMVPPNDFIQKIFNTQVTFRNEIGFYKHIIPCLQEYQREQGARVLDFAPGYYGSRVNLQDDANSPVDADSALVLENLKLKGYRNLDRFHGFDLVVTKLVLQQLAYLQATSIALKRQHPELFSEKINPYLSTWKSNSGMKQDLVQQVPELLSPLEDLKKYESRITAGLLKKYDGSPRQKWCAITHNDCWVNNIMVHMVDGNPEQCKLVDFQVCDFASLAKDVIFFLFSSVQMQVIREDYDKLIRLYYSTFIETLKDLSCSTDEYSFESFEDELAHEAINSQFFHLFFMIFPIFAPADTAKDIADYTPEDFKRGKLCELHLERFRFLITEFVSRNWI